MRTGWRTRSRVLSRPVPAEPGLAVALVADDLTGALDAAAPFAGRGLGVTVHRSAASLPVPPEPPGSGASGSDARPGTRKPSPSGAVLAVSTSSRHLAPGAARTAVEAAARRLRAWSPRLVYKKIDSTLRGPVPDEVAAAMEAFERRTAVVCPAFPAAGRVVRDGEVFVHGRPLRATEYVRDLRTPSPSESLRVLFDRIGSVRAIRPGEPPENDLAAEVWIADAETDGHLAGLASRVAERAADVLAVGSDGLAAGLASLVGRPGPPVRLTGREGRILMYALGSRAATTEEQTARLLAVHPGIPVVEAPAGVLDAGAVVRAAASVRAVVARVPASPRGEPGSVARAFAAGVREAVLGLGGPPRLAALVATGGDTVEAILDAFDIGVLDVRGELRPGIPVSRGTTEGAELALVSKAGGFGTPELFAELAADTLAP